MRRWILAVASAAILASGSRTAGQGLPAPAVPLGLGVNIHFVEPPARDVAMIAAAGFRFVRMDLFWWNIEHQRGRYDFSGYDHLVAALEKHQIRPYFILDYGNSHYDGGLPPHTDAGRQAFTRFAAAAAAHFRGHGVIWELWNEPNLGYFWKPQPNVDDYMALAKVALPAVRQADPDATIVGPATSRVDLTFLEGCFQQGLLELVDAVSVHPYRGGPPETATDDYTQLRALIARYAPKGKESLPILSGEWGYSAAGISRAEQGQYLAREFLTNLMNGLPISIWYDWHDDGQNAHDPEQNYGTVTWNYQPKPAYGAAQTLIHELDGFHFARRLPLGSDADYAALFENGSAQKLVVWTIGPAHGVTLPAEVHATTIVDMLGEQQMVAAEGGPVALELTGSPQYLTLGSGGDSP